MFENKKKLSKKVFNILTGMIVGGAVGSILGLTMAPQKGKDTRQFLKDKSKDLLSGPSAGTAGEKKPGLLKRLTSKILKRPR